MKTFKDLEFETLKDSFRTGKVGRMSFDNGYGISVVSHTHSYGGDKGLYEIGVLGPDDNITYETIITNDVIGYLDENEVSKYMEQIQKLPKNV